MDYTKNGWKSHRYIDFSYPVPPALLELKCHPFDLKLPISNTWGDSDYRLLVVTNYVDSPDLRDGKLLGSQGGVVITNILNRLSQQYTHITGKTREWAKAAISFNYFKSYHLDQAYYGDVNRASISRIKAYIKKIKPTHVAILGDIAAEALFESKDVYHKRGWVRNLDLDGLEVKVVHTIDISKCYVVQNVDDTIDDNDGYIGNEDDATDNANLLGFVCRNLLSLYFKQAPFNISKVKPNPILIETVKDWEKLYARLRSAKRFAVDTEDANLNVYGNALLTVQFALDSTEGYILPVCHIDSPFTQKQLEKIQNQLAVLVFERRSYSKEDPEYLIVQNGKFDYRIFRQQLKIPLVRWPLFDTMAGLYVLDENLKTLQNYGPSYASLKQLCALYGNDFYYQKSTFNKEDRSRVAETELRDPGFLNYAAMDVQSIYALSEVMMKEASFQRMCRIESYRENYIRFVTCQMSNNINMFGHMEQRGVNVDVKYLFDMLGAKSPLNMLIEDETAKLMASPAVKKASAIIGANSNIPTKGLFGAISKNYFDLSVVKHKVILFFQVLKLKPVSYGAVDPKTGKPKPSMGSDFQEKYKADYPEVAALQRIGKLGKLKSSYINSFYRKISESEDGRVDGKLRPGWGFWEVVTGRGNSYQPSLQQIPQRSAESKYIKRMFTAKRNHLILKLDESAHEVRCIHLDMYVDTEVGRIQLKDFLELPQLPRVKSFNHITHRVEYQPIISSSRHTTDEHMLEIEYEGGSIWVTENHRVWSETRGMYIEAIDIQPEENILIDTESV